MPEWSEWRRIFPLCSRGVERVQRLRRMMASPLRTPLADDTPLDIEIRQVALWQRMSRDEKAALVTGLCRAVHEAATAGIQRRYPDATPREQFLRLAILRLGRDLCSQAFPDAADLQE